MNKMMCRALLVATVFASATMFLSSQASAQLLPWRRAAVCCPPVHVVDPCCGYTNFHRQYHVGVFYRCRPVAYGYSRTVPAVYRPVYYTSTMPATTCCGVTYPMESEPVGAVIQQPMPEAQYQQRFESGTVTVEPPPDADRLPSNPRGRDQ
ncbi:MAG TPA: hypothetical protein PKD54_06155 [Pirellulaceae bacterium]|nr:hypothetical protein [Pirellulaceae bacterium]